MIYAVKIIHFVHHIVIRPVKSTNMMYVYWERMLGEKKNHHVSLGHAD